MSDANQPASDFRIACHLLGCETSNFPCCQRCGTDLYDPDFVQIGKPDWLFELYYHVRYAIRCALPRKCRICKQRYWRGYSGYVCSEECAEDDIPF